MLSTSNPTVPLNAADHVYEYNYCQWVNVVQWSRSPIPVALYAALRIIYFFIYQQFVSIEKRIEVKKILEEYLIAIWDEWYSLSSRYITNKSCYIIIYKHKLVPSWKYTINNVAGITKRTGFRSYDGMM